MVDEDDSVDINPWPVSELVTRTACFGAVAQRLALEINVSGTEDLFDLETDRFDLQAWARLELAASLSGTELSILNTSVSELSPRQQDQCLEGMLATTTLGWYLGFGGIDRLPIDVTHSVENVALTWVPSPWDQVRNIVTRSRPRSIEQLAMERERWELLYWRMSVDMQLPESANALADVVAEISDLESFAVRDGDFTIDSGRVMAELSTTEHEELAQIAVVRLRTLNWICGLGASWENAPLLLDD